MKNKVYSSDHITRALGGLLAVLSLIIFVSAFTKTTWGIAFIFEYVLGLAGYWILLPLLLIYGIALVFKGQKLKNAIPWKMILGLILALLGLGFIFGYISATFYSTNSLNLFDLFGTESSGLMAEFSKGKGPVDLNNGGGIVFCLLSSLLNKVSGALSITLIVIILLAALFFVFYPFIMRFFHFIFGKYSMHKIKKEAEEEERASEEEKRRSLEAYIEENKPIEIHDDIENIALYNQVSPEQIPNEPALTRSNLYHSETATEISPVPQETAPTEPVVFSNESFDSGLKEAVFALDLNDVPQTETRISEPQISSPSVSSKPAPTPNVIHEESTIVLNPFANEDPFEETKVEPSFDFNEQSSTQMVSNNQSYEEKPTVEVTISENNVAPVEEMPVHEEIHDVQEEIKEDETSYQGAIKPSQEDPAPRPQPVFVQEKLIEIPSEEPVETPLKATPAPIVEPQKEEDPLKDMPKAKERPPYQLPPIELLRTIEKDPKVEEENQVKCEIRKEKINQAIAAFNVKAQVVSFTAGPSVTRYDIEFQPGVRSSTLNTYIPDICRSLGGINARYEEVIMGKTTSGLEIPNEKSTTVSFKELIQAMPTDEKSTMNIPFGVNISGEKVFADLSKFPHMLIAGGTGSGKSVYANSLLATLIMRNRPEDLKLVLVDPKKVEMTKYKDIPHLLCPIITEPAQAKVCLDKLVDEMERRYDIFAHTGAKDIRSFNTKYAPKAGLEPMPFIVVFIDEYANLVDSVKAVSDPVAQIAAKARAAGIHLIVATQRPSVNVITGTIKANLDVRVALKVNANQDSQTVLGKGGAEELNGNGDMLVQCSLISKGGGFIRCQGCFLQDEEIDAIVDFVKSQQKVTYDPYFSDLVDHSQDAKMAEENDKMERAFQREQEKSDRYEAIKADIMMQEYTSISKIQRTYGMGYPMAQRVFARLQAEGIVAQASSQSSSKGAKVLVHDDSMYRDGNESFYGDND